MKAISLRCSCGASINLSDEAESYILPDTGKPDKKGRRYQIELRADDWLDRHSACITIKNQLLIKASELKTAPRITRAADGKVL